MKKLAVIGCGGIGTYHLEHLVLFSDIELVGFCDLIPERAEGFVKKAGKGKAFTDYKVMYDAVSPDMVFICVPPTCHGDIEFETIKRGIHFFVEKPVTLDIELAKKICTAAAEKRLITASGFQCRYDNINETAKQFVKDNQIVTVGCSRVGSIPQVDWWFKKSTCGGQLVEQTIHQLDIMRYLLGDVEYVFSVNDRGYITSDECPGYDNDDLSTTILKFKNGVTAHLMTGCYSLDGACWDSKMTFGGRKARLDYILTERVTVFGINEADKVAETKGVISGDGTLRRSESEIGITIKNNIDFGVECDRTFVEAVISGDASKIRSPYADAMATLAVGLACNKSMETGLPVKISEIL